MKQSEFKDYALTLKQLQSIRDDEKCIREIDFSGDNFIIKGDSEELHDSDFYSFDSTYEKLKDIKERETCLRKAMFYHWSTEMSLESIHGNKADFYLTEIKYMSEDDINKVGNKLRHNIHDPELNSNTESKFMTFTETMQAIYDIMQGRPEIDSIEFNRVNNSFTIISHNRLSRHTIFCSELNKEKENK